MSNQETQSEQPASKREDNSGSSCNDLLSGMLFQVCVACEGSGQLSGQECLACKSVRVMPVGVTNKQLEKMHERVETLPKTADGKPICLGDTVYVVNEDRSYWGDDDVLAIRVDTISRLETFDTYNGRSVISGGLNDGGGSDWEGGNLDCYRSREAVPVAR